MSIHQYISGGVGLGHVGAYQVSGMPFASGSIDASTAYKVVEFPYVTRWVQIINHDTNELIIAFTENQIQNVSAGSNHIKLHPSFNPNREGGYLPRLEMKVTKLYFTGSNDFDVIAGLTNISTNMISGNWTGSVGVG